MTLGYLGLATGALVSSVAMLLGVLADRLMLCSRVGAFAEENEMGTRQSLDISQSKRNKQKEIRPSTHNTKPEISNNCDEQKKFRQARILKS